MQRICFLLQVKPDRLEEYKERHKSVWPEMRAALSATGWHNYSLFRRLHVADQQSVVAQEERVVDRLRGDAGLREGARRNGGDRSQRALASGDERFLYGRARP